METRDELILSMRGETYQSLASSGADERFQNLTLRPVLKLQNDLFADVFRNYVAKYKDEFYSYQVEKKLSYIDNAIQKDIKFRNSLKGIVIGMFTRDEYAHYITNSSSLNKRMMNLLAERLKDQVLLFESPH